MINAIAVMALINSMNVNPEYAHFYAKSAVVTEVNYSADVVTCEDFNGFLWQFEGCEDWLEGDIASMVMFDNGTTSIYDDVILSALYTGWVY